MLMMVTFIFLLMSLATNKATTHITLRINDGRVRNKNRPI
jgi:hypothetical protein